MGFIHTAQGRHGAVGASPEEVTKLILGSGARLDTAGVVHLEKRKLQGDLRAPSST